MISTTMPAGPSTLADLRKAGIVSSHEIVAAIDAYMRDPAASPHRFPSGHRLDIAAIVTSSIDPADIENRAGPQQKTFRTAVTTAVMASRPTPP